MKWGRDKYAHAIICFMGTIALSVFMVPWQAALGMFLLFSIGKDVINDLILGRGNFSWGDIVANAGGSLIGLGVLLIVKGLIP